MSLSSPSSSRITLSQKSTIPSFTASLNLDARYLSEFENGNFIYLKRKHDSDHGTYDLEVVEHYETNPSNYYTMSKEGVTHFTTESSDFCPLAKWELEYTRFKQMRQIRFFQTYRLWKNYNVWKRNIHVAKMQHAKSELNAHLFCLNASLQTILIKVRALTLDVTALSLLKFEPKKTYTLRAWEQEQKDAMGDLTMHLSTFSSHVLSLCVTACDTVVDSFLEKHKIVAEHKMTFMERAALRKECRRLTHFIRLIDFLVIDAMMQLSIKSFQSLLNMWRSPPPPQSSLSLSSATKANSAVSTAVITPLFSILVRVQHCHRNSSIDSETRTAANDADADDVGNGGDDVQIVLTPPADAWTQAFESVLKQSLTVIDLPYRLLGHPSLLAYTSATAEDEGKTMGWSIAELNLAALLNENQEFTGICESIFEALDESFVAIENYMDIFEPYLTTYKENLDAQAHPERLHEASIETFSDTISMYQAQSKTFVAIPSTGVVSVFRLDSDEFKQQLLPAPAQSILSIRALLPQLMKTQSHALLSKLGEWSPIAFSKPSAPDTFVEKVIHMEKLTNVLPQLKAEYRRIYDMAVLMENYDWRIQDDSKEDLILMKEGVLSLEGTLISFETELETETVRFTHLIQDMLPPMEQKVNEIAAKLDDPILAMMETPIPEALAYLRAQESSLNAIAAKLKQYQVQLKQGPSKLNSLETVMDDLKLKMKLWTGIREWNTLMASYREMPLGAIETDTLASQVQLYIKLASQAQRALPANEVAMVLFNHVEQFKLVLPIVNDLRGSFLKDRHWKQIHDIFGFTVKGDTSLTLGTLMERQVMQYADAISVVSVAAQQESVLESMLAKVVAVWKTLELEVKPYKDAKDIFILGRFSILILIFILLILILTFRHCSRLLMRTSVMMIMLMSLSIS